MYNQHDPNFMVQTSYRSALYNFFAQVFMDPIPVPGDTYARKILNSLSAFLESDDDSEKSPGYRYFHGFVTACTVKDYQHVQKELAIDRTFLCRGIDEAHGPVPPYEALYASKDSPAHMVFTDLLAAYQQNGFAIHDSVKERPDYIGLEMAFMSELCTKEGSVIAHADDYNQILEEERKFLKFHLLNWIPVYCSSILVCAKTDFFKGFASFLVDFLVEESIYLGLQMDFANP